MARISRTEDRRRPWTVLVGLGILTLLAVGNTAAATAEPPGRIERVRYQADAHVDARHHHAVASAAVRDPRPRRRARAQEPTPARPRVLERDARPEAMTPIRSRTASLQQIRSGQFNARTARIVPRSREHHASTTSRRTSRRRTSPSTSRERRPPKLRPAAPASRKRKAAPPPPARPAEVASVPPPPAAPPHLDDTRPARARARSRSRRAQAPAERHGSTDRPTAADVTQRTPARSPSRCRHPHPSAVRRPAKANAGSEPVPGRPPNRPWRIVLDPGHGGADPGASGVDGLLEKDVVLAIAQRLKRRLEESSNAKVLLTRETDTTRYARRAHRLRQRQRRRPLHLDPCQRRP